MPSLFVYVHIHSYSCTQKTYFGYIHPAAVLAYRLITARRAGCLMGVSNGVSTWVSNL